MPKQYTKTISSCTHCPNAIVSEPISNRCHYDYRCRSTAYRNGVYRLIHYEDRLNIPSWCPLQEVEMLELPY